MKSIQIKNSWFNDSDLRLDASYHLSDGPLTKLKLKDSPYELTTLSQECVKIFSGNIFKRTYVNDTKNGWPYLTGSDMIKADINSGKYISKKYTAQAENLQIHKNWILITCSGTLGNCVFTDEDFEGRVGTHDLIRAIPNERNVLKGYLYAYLSSKYGYGLLTQSSYGGVVKHIEPHHIQNLPIPILPEQQQQRINDLIIAAVDLRVEANKILKRAQKEIKELAKLPDLNNTEYDYFGNNSKDKEVTVFSRNISEIKATSINAFNYSKKIEILENRVKQRDYKFLIDCLDDNQFFSTGSFKRLELNSSKSIKLINQSDIFNIRKKGKLLARAFAKTNRLAEYGEVLIAGVGTLGEGETFCRSIFINEELQGQLLAGEFIRMKTNKSVPSGYLYSWLSSDYGFRFIRKTQTGTKLCRPIQELLKEIPVPVLGDDQMNKIDGDVKRAHTLMYEAYCKENEGIELIEKEIESWQK